MTRTCATCGRTWGRRAAFCGGCGDLLDTSLAARATPGAAGSGWWRRPAVTGSLAVVVVVAVVAAVPAVSIGGVPPVDGEVGVPAADELQAASGTRAAPRRAADPPAITCSGPQDPADCVLWSRALAPPLEPGSSSHSWVVAGGDRVVVGAEHHVEGVDADTGTRLWRVPRDPKTAPLGLGREVLVLGDDETLQVVGLDDGAVRWSSRRDTLDALDGPVTFVRRRSAGDLVITGPPPSVDGPGVAARDARDGALAWVWRGPRDGGSVHVRPLDGDRLLVGFGGSSTGLTVLDARTGAELHGVPEGLGAWVMDVVGDIAVTVHERSSPSRNRGGDPGGFLRGVDLASGDVVWEQPLRALDTRIQLAAGLALVPTARHLTAIDVGSGEIAWEVPTTAMEQVAGARLWGLPTVDTPAAAAVVVTFRTGQTEVLARHPRTASVLWRRELPATVQYAAMSGEEVIVVTDDGFHVLDARTGEDRRVLFVRPLPLVAHDPLVLFDPVSGHVVRVADAVPPP